jgi:hypothetical protein
MVDETQKPRNPKTGILENSSIFRKKRTGNEFAMGRQNSLLVYIKYLFELKII